jgi:hypothetical protein
MTAPTAPTAPSPREHLAEVASFVRDDLAALNRSCRGTPAGLNDWLAAVRPILHGVDITADHLGPDQGLVLLQMLGFLVASGERHAQNAGQEPGWVIRQFEGLDRALVVAAQGGRAPALTAELYFKLNDGRNPVAFTDEPHELLFISAVRTQVELRATVNRQLRSVLDDWRVDTAEGARMLRIATAAMRESRGEFIDLRRGVADSPAMTPECFGEIWAWLTPTVVCGQRLSGPDTGQLADMVATDVLVGTADEQYATYARENGPYQSPEGRYMIAEDLRRPSLVLTLADALGLDPVALDRASCAEVAQRVRRAPQALVMSLDAFTTLVDHHVGASGAHLGLVNTLMPAGERSRRRQEQTYRLHTMRRKASRVRKLVNAFRQSHGQRPNGRPVGTVRPL